MLDWLARYRGGLKSGGGTAAKTPSRPSVPTDVYQPSMGHSVDLLVYAMRL